MIKDIAVNLSVSAKEGHSAEDYAISTASALGAHITGVAFIYDTTVPLVYPLMSYGETPPEVIDALKREKADLAKEAAERFTKAASPRALPVRLIGSVRSREGLILQLSGRSNLGPTPTKRMSPKAPCFVPAVR